MDIEAAAAVAYSENTLLRAAVTAIPYVGGPLDIILSSKGRRIVQERINHLLTSLAKQLEDVHESQIDKAFLETEEFFDILISGIEAATRMRDDEIRTTAAHVLAGAIKGNAAGIISVEHVMAVLRQLSQEHLVVARAIFERQSSGPTGKENPLQWALRCKWNDLAEDLGMEQGDLFAACLVLQSAGLVGEVTGAYYDYTGGVFVMTPVLGRLMELARAGTASASG